VFDYLVSLPQKTLEDLYQDPWTCQAIFRALPPLSKQYVVRLLFPGVQSEVAIDGWVKPGEESKHRVAIERLLALQVCSRSSLSSDSRQNMKKVISTLKLNPLFQNQLKKAVCQTYSSLGKSKRITFR